MQGDLCKFESSLIYIASSKTQRAIERDQVSENQTTLKDQRLKFTSGFHLYKCTYICMHRPYVHTHALSVCAHICNHTHALPTTPSQTHKHSHISTTRTPPPPPSSHTHREQGFCVTQSLDTFSNLLACCKSEPWTAWTAATSPPGHIVTQ